MSRPKQKPQQVLIKRCSVEELDVRPVTSKDKWCYRPSAKNGQPLKEGNWGYIVTLPSIPKKPIVIEGLGGYSVVRSKKLSGQFLLQIVLACYDNHYAILAQEVTKKSSKRMKHSKSKKKSYALSVQNLGK